MTSSIDSAEPSTWPAPWFGSDHDTKEMFVRARGQTLNLIQWLARIANSYVADSPVESRLVLNFCPDGSFVTQTFERDIALELRVPTLELQFQERGKRVPHVLDPEERSPAEVEAWILVELLHRGLNRDKFSKSLPYTIPNLMTGDAEDYSPRACGTGLAQLTAWFCAASAVLSSRGRIVCFPQTLTLAAVAASGTPVVGFSPGDSKRDEPFFFATSRCDGKHAVLAASDLAVAKDPLAAAMEFTKAAGDATHA